MIAASAQLSIASTPVAVCAICAGGNDSGTFVAYRRLHGRHAAGHGDMVDRRFNRARYDADKTTAAFAGRLKDAVDLDAVRNDLASVVHQTLEPAHLSIWIRPRD